MIADVSTGPQFTLVKIRQLFVEGPIVNLYEKSYIVYNWKCAIVIPQGKKVSCENSLIQAKTDTAIHNEFLVINDTYLIYKLWIDFC